MKIEKDPGIPALTEIVRIPIASWDQGFSAEEQASAVGELEKGNVLWFPALGFTLQPEEQVLLTPAMAGKGKNISLDPVAGTVRGSSAGEAELKLLHDMIHRYAESSRAL